MKNSRDEDAVELAADRLHSNAEVVAALLADVDDAQARWRPAPDHWSILEVVRHLADEEVEDFRTRLDLTLHHTGGSWPAIDPVGWVTSRGYNEGFLNDAKHRFFTRRGASVGWLRTLDRPELSRAYTHARLGPISAADLLVSWVAHDHIHIRQLNRLKRAFFVESMKQGSPDYAGPW